MADKYIKIDSEMAEIILKMEYACYIESIGPESDKLLELIKDAFPDLYNKYN